MTTLESIAIADFKSFGARVETRLRPLNVLIGANGAGKSNFLEAFSFLQAYASNGVEELVMRSGGAAKVVHLGPRCAKASDIQMQFSSEDRFFLRLIPAVSDELGTSGTLPSSNSSLDNVDELKKFLATWRLYHFLDTGFHSPMKKTTKLHDNRYLRKDGANLAPFLYLLRERHEASYRMIRNTVRLVAPFFDDFALEPLELGPDTIRLEWRHRNSDAYFDAAALSDGTLRFMALAALLLQPAALRPGIVLLDEPELGLHPYAIAMLASMLRSASTETQIIAATQSSGLIDHFGPEDVVVAERVSGETRLERLEAEPLRKWLEEYSLGQLWEKNHFGGRPARDGADAG